MLFQWLLQTFFPRSKNHSTGACTLSHMITLSIKMFGALRQYRTEDLVVQVANGSTVGMLKDAIAEALVKLGTGFNDAPLIEQSAIANSKRIYGSDEVITEAMDLAVLPPVCGG